MLYRTVDIFEENYSRILDKALVFFVHGEKTFKHYRQQGNTICQYVLCFFYFKKKFYCFSITKYSSDTVYLLLNIIKSLGDLYKNTDITFYMDCSYIVRVLDRGTDRLTRLEDRSISIANSWIDNLFSKYRENENFLHIAEFSKASSMPEYKTCLDLLDKLTLRYKDSGIYNFRDQKTLLERICPQTFIPQKSFNYEPKLEEIFPEIVEIGRAHV